MNTIQRMARIKPATLKRIVLASMLALSIGSVVGAAATPDAAHAKMCLPCDIVYPRPPE